MSLGNIGIWADNNVSATEVVIVRTLSLGSTEGFSSNSRANFRVFWDGDTVESGAAVALLVGMNAAPGYSFLHLCLCVSLCQTASSC